MIAIAAYFLSFYMGYLLLRIIRPLKTIDIFLIPGIGMGASFLLVFYSLLIFNQIYPQAIMVLHLLVILVLFFYNRALGESLVSFKKKEEAIIIVLLLTVAFLSAMLAAGKPYGEWDAWSYWNYHANYLLRAGTHWPRIFEYNMQGQHPWMLPCLVILGWVVAGQEQIIVPISIAIIFTVSCVGLLIYALREYVSFYWAVLAGLFLVSIPFYLVHGTSQYADILLAYYLLAVCVMIFDLIRSPSKPAAFLTGLLLGFAGCSKDNGVAAVVIFLTVIAFYFKKSSVMWIQVRPIFWGCIMVLTAVLLMKSFYWWNYYYHAYDIVWSHLHSIERWKLIGDFTGRAFFNSMWGMVWPLGLLAIVFNKHREQPQVGVVLWFMAIYVLFYFLVYNLSLLELEWLLNVSFDRLLFLLAPTFVFVMFYLIGKKEAL